jgi:16S rRNA (cytosine1407-C5)-methyltransferase
VAQGKIYQQNLSSMIPAVILDPQPGERLLDACAAPGSKTTQMAAMIGAQGSIVAVESSRSRFFRLRAVCELLGATNVETKLCDLRRYRPAEGDLFDRILVDAPCSSEGRFKDDLSKTTDYWSVRKIKEMSYKQKGILMSAARLLKPGGALVYATCTFAPEENEEVVDWFLERSQGAFALEKISLPGVPAMPCLPEWQRHTYSAAIDQCLRVRPDGIYSGFFVAKFRKG